MTRIATPKTAVSSDWSYSIATKAVFVFVLFIFLVKTVRTQRQPVRKLDKLDHHILRILQEDGRIAMKDLAERVGLTVTPCIERVKRMERDGVIMGYYARVDPAQLGAALLVFVEITLGHK